MISIRRKRIIRIRQFRVLLVLFVKKNYNLTRREAVVDAMLPGSGVVCTLRLLALVFDALLLAPDFPTHKNKNIFCDANGP